MRIISWNINGYRAVTGQNPSKRYDEITKNNKLFAYIQSSNPDIICLQETKADMEQIVEINRLPEGYQGKYFSATSKKGYSGVVTFDKLNARHEQGFGVEKFDVEGRVIISYLQDLILLNIYFPKGYADNERLDYKLEFYDAIFDCVEKLKNINKNIVICGDYNTAHNPIDLARPKENEQVSGFLEVERKKLDQLCELGFVDAFREKHHGGGHYSWWSNRGQARRNNVGWRIDYHFVSEPLCDKIVDCFYEPDVLGSDHCPTVLDLDI